MSTSQADAIALYLQQIRPFDLVTLRSRVQHDYEMLVSSFASYLELLEALLIKLTLPDDIRGNIADYCVAFREQVAAHPSIMAWYADELDSMTPERYLTALSCDLRCPISTFIGYATLLKYDIEAHQSTSTDNQRAAHLIDALHSTAEHMATVLSASHTMLQLHRTAS